jgi:hypothetical protein
MVATFFTVSFYNFVCVPTNINKVSCLKEVFNPFRLFPAEEWCAVCHDGGDLLYCCDRCPKVYHLTCYIPPMLKEPEDNWV